MAEWLTHWIANPDLSGCVGSNPALSVYPFWQIEGCLDSKTGKSVLTNSSYTILIRQKLAMIDNMQNIYIYIL